MDGIFVFDADWKEVYQKPDTFVKLKWSASGPQEGVGTDSLRRNHLISYSAIYTKSGPHHVAVEVLDQGVGSIGTFRDQRTFSFSDTALSVSDLLLASEIESQKPSPEDRKDLKIIPNPLRTFRRSEPVSVYFEVYNLKPDRDGRTEYDVSYRIGRPEKKEIDPALFAALDLPEAQARVEIEGVQEEGGPVDYRVRYVLPDRNRISSQIIGRADKETEIAVTARYTGERRDDFAYLQVDVGQMPRGVYKLTVAVKDVRSGRTAERDALFRVIE
ncbi:MAG: hypothetical protein A3F84_01785 [Candidatus Handelsmanbacteria bacterium RIFCSPLOWO2_12_FULL_64_10]|uniref:GWxTD domain-containing protein n=1 Tax=Handelsmanbacteria sp. (strain RIFCSPLOWO2_12_FULL_64_10) TaxID=1817868 RepID=A0A1F6C9M0_HANXR|nr:MAG: hypothetical protein A3F84_01785 [Candidatus Handelsmanbacteria bacterium RIFCSPLOWO2_12_FULL_64_10]